MSASKNLAEKAFSYISDNQDRFVSELNEFLSFPSISSQTLHNGDVRECAKWLENHLSNIGLEAGLIETKGHPIVWGKGKGKSSKKLIIYGHYDVQPEDPLNLWRTDPFRPCIRDGIIYARGATDDKGPLFAHVKAVESLIKTEGALPCDVLFLFEGEEESGGTSLTDYLYEHNEEISTDAILLSDTAMYDRNTPAITYGLKGLLAFEITITSIEQDLHSGTFGGAILNPAILLSQIIAKCVNSEGKITVPGFYDKVKEIETWEKENIEKLKFDVNSFLEQAGTKQIWGDKDYSVLERIWTRPTLEVNGLISGYSGSGVKTIIPNSATAKMSARLVPDQNPNQILSLIKEYLNSICPDSVELTISSPFSSANPIVFDTGGSTFQKGCNALKEGFGIDPVFIRTGGSIPVVNAFWDNFKKPIILMGLGLDSNGAHSPNEHFSIEHLICGAKSSAYFIKYL